MKNKHLPYRIFGRMIRWHTRHGKGDIVTTAGAHVGYSFVHRAIICKYVYYFQIAYANLECHAMASSQNPYLTPFNWITCTH